MADNIQSRSTLEDTSTDPELKPDTTPNPVEELNPANDLRAQDYGESGQFAPGGYYNQTAATRPERINLDEQFPDSGGEKSKT
jgi:hypothetical protein